MESNALSEIRTWIGDNQLTLLVCNALKPKIANLAEEYESLQVRYLDLETAPEIAGQYGVFARYFGMHEIGDAVERYNSLLQDT